MSRGNSGLQNLEKSAQVRTKELFEVVGGLFGQQYTVGFHLPPVGHCVFERAFHPFQTAPQVCFLKRERCLQDSSKYFLVSLLQCLLDSLCRVKGGAPRMFVAACREIP